MVVSNAIVCDVNGEYEIDIRIVDGIITEIAKGLKDDEILDAKGNYFLPLMVDTNVRLQDSTLNSKNSFIIHLPHLVLILWLYICLSAGHHTCLIGLAIFV